MDNYYPPFGFHYSVNFGGNPVSLDMQFQTVSGLSVEYTYENFKEGGENRFEHKLPVRTNYSDLILKRGMVTQSKTITWFLDAFNHREFLPMDLTIILMNEKGLSLRVWKVAHALPKKWSVSDFNASESSLVIETMELSYRYFNIE